MLKTKLLYFAVITGLAAYCLPIISYEVPRTDSGVFLSIGQMILDGEIPYLDVFDHKGPLLYFINAFGILLGGGHLWGIRIIEIFFVCSSALLSYSILKRLFSDFAAVFGTSAWLGGLPLVMNGGNYCEEYGLLFQFLGLYSGMKILEQLTPKYIYGFGLTLGAVICLRPNLIGLHLAVILYLFYRFGTLKQWRSMAGITLWISGGVICVVIPFVIYFFIHGALFEMWDQLFVFNSAYSSGSAAIRLKNILNLISYNVYYGLPVISLMAVVFFINTITRKNISDAAKPAVIIALTGLLATTGLVLLSLRSDVNYYLSLLPPYSVLAGYFAYTILQTKFKWRYFGLIIIWILISLVSFRQWIGYVNRNLIIKKEPLTGVIEFIQTRTKQDDRLLLWGAETRINLVTGRKSPSKYAYQWPLYRVGYVNDSHVDRFLSDIRENKPVLIIDTKNGNFASLDSVKRKRWLKNYRSPYHQMPESMNAVIHYIHSHYSKVDTVLSPDWDIYRLNPGN